MITEKTKKDTLRLMIFVYIMVIISTVLAVTISPMIHKNDTVEAQLIRIDEGNEHKVTTYEYSYRYRGERHSEFTTEPIDGKTKLGTIVTLPLMDESNIRTNIIVCVILLIIETIFFTKRYSIIKRKMTEEMKEGITNV